MEGAEASEGPQGGPEEGGRYASDLQGRLSEVSAGILSNYLAVPEETGLVIQEKARGRRLITIPGRLTHRMANKIAHQIDGGRGLDRFIPPAS